MYVNLKIKKFNIIKFLFGFFTGIIFKNISLINHIFLTVLSFLEVNYFYVILLSIIIFLFWRKGLISLLIKVLTVIIIGIFKGWKSFKNSNNNKYFILIIINIIINKYILPILINDTPFIFNSLDNNEINSIKEKDLNLEKNNNKIEKGGELYELYILYFWWKFVLFSCVGMAAVDISEYALILVTLKMTEYIGYSIVISEIINNKKGTEVEKEEIKKDSSESEIELNND